MRPLLVCLALVGCASAPTIEDHATACAAYGYAHGTDAFAQCVQTQALAYQAGRQAQAQRMQAAGAILMQQSQAMRAQQQYRAPIPYTPVVNCRRTAWGSQCW
jgi:hypothetical protein